MVHWPETMVTYESTNSVLFSAMHLEASGHTTVVYLMMRSILHLKMNYADIIAILLASTDNKFKKHYQN